MDKTQEFLTCYARVSKAIQSGKPLPAPEDAKDLLFLWIPGLLGREKRCYITHNDEALRALGLASEILWSIDTIGTVAKNAQILRDLLPNYPKRIVVIGHSKGAVDAASALTLYPELRKRVAKFVALQAPYLGSPMADFYCSTRLMRRVLKTLAEHFGGDPRAVEDLTT